MNHMKLLTKKLREQLPPLYSQEDVEDPMVSAKFFTPDAGFSWYATEGSPVDENGIMINEGETTPEADFLFFGYVIGLEAELGYFYGDVSGCRLSATCLLHPANSRRSPAGRCGKQRQR
jgi:hypothetical protein